VALSSGQFCTATQCPRCSHHKRGSGAAATLLHTSSCPLNVFLTHPATLYPSQINAEKAPFLTERLKIWMLPTLALIQHEKTVDYVAGFDQVSLWVLKSSPGVVQQPLPA
jgi:hypothetical protein